MPGILRWSIRGFGVLMILATATWIVLSMVSCSRLEAALQEFRSDTTLKDPLMDASRQVPPQNNGAPLFTAAFALFEGLGKPPGDVAWVVAKGWSGVPEASRERVRKWLDSAEEAFDLAERGAHKPRCVFERSYDPNRWRIQLAEIGQLNWMTHALAIRGRMLGSEGKSEEARRSIAVAFAVADCLREDPFLPSQAIRASLHDQVCRAIPEALGSRPSAKDLEEWIKIVPGPERLDGAVESGLRGEAFALAENAGGTMGEFWETIPWFAVDTPSSLTRRLYDPWARMTLASSLAEIRRMISLSRLPAAEVWKEAVRIRSESRGGSGFGSQLRLHWGNLPLTIETKRAALLVTRAGLEFERIRAETGRYPDRCETIDPFTGKPLLLESGPARLATDGRMDPGWPSRTFEWILLGK